MKKLLLSLLFVTTLITTSYSQVVISEIYGGGGNSGALYKNDFIELYNPSTSAVNLTGWSVQYASAGGDSWNKTALSGFIPAKGYYLIQQVAGTGGTVSLPAPDASGKIALSATAGKVALCSNDISLTGSAPSSTAIKDLIGFGITANFYEGHGLTGAGAAPTPSNNNRSLERKANAGSTEASMSNGGVDEFAGNGYDTDFNNTDFFTRIPQPQNSASASEPDFAAPVYSDNYPQASNVNTTSFDLLVSLNEKGIAYYILLPDAAPAPTAEQVKAGKDASGNAVSQSGSLAIQEASTAFSSTFSGLISNTSYSVYLVSEDLNSNLQASAFKLDVKTAFTVQPDVIPAKAMISFLGYTAKNKLSVAESLSFTASNLQADIQVSVSGPYLISKTENGVYDVLPVTFSKDEFSSSATQTVFVKFNPENNTGIQTGSLNISTNNTSDKIVSLEATSIDPFNQNFNDVNYLSNSGWSQVSISGDINKWSYSASGPNSAPGSAIMNGFSEAGASNDWLISPSLDLSSFSNYSILSFFSREFFAGPDLKLLVSTTYNDSGIINPAEWTEINGDFPATTGSWKLSDNINLTAYKSSNTRIAFVYQSTAGGSNYTSEWKVDDFKVENLQQFNSIPTAYYSFNETLPGSISAAQTFSFKTGGYGDISITASQGFEVSNNGQNYSSSVVINEADAYAGSTISVRFAPQTRQVNHTGSLTFTGSGFSVSSVTLAGSSIFKSETFDIAAYNIEFFGSDIRDKSGVEFGPTNDALQISNVSQVMKKLDLDIYAVSEVSDTEAFDQLVAGMPGYDKVLSNRYSYSFEAADPNFPAQQNGFIYNTATITKLSEEVLFESLFDELRAGTATLENYPGGSSASFWSSGRLPYMATFNAKIDGKTQTYRVIVIHAKSGSSTADYNRRKYDVDYLHAYLDSNYKNDNIILLGDYNDDVDNSIRVGYPTSYQKFVEDKTNYTTITSEISTQPGIGTFVGGNNPSFIDHILISNDLNSEYLQNSISIEDARNYVSQYSTTTSDHLPIYARFSLPEVAPVVNVSSFDAQVVGNTVQLSWSTANEFNNDYFTVERSNNGQKKFESLIRVEGSVYSANEKTYTANDNYPYNGNSYYRLKQTNLDGTFTYSNIVSVKLTDPKNHLEADAKVAMANGSVTSESTGKTMRLIEQARVQQIKLGVYPNPFSKFSSVAFTLPTDESIVTLDVYDMKGSRISRIYNGKAGANQTLKFDFDGSSLSPGMYFLRLTTLGKVENFKMMMTE